MCCGCNEGLSVSSLMHFPHLLNNSNLVLLEFNKKHRNTEPLIFGKSGQDSKQI